jgi:5'(3')-deoxyribonucleotidase
MYEAEFGPHDPVDFWRRIMAGDKELKSLKDRYDRSVGFNSSLKAYEGAEQTIKALDRRGFNVYFLTSPDTQSSTYHSEIQGWVRRVFGQEFCSKIIFSCDKTVVGFSDPKMVQAADGSWHAENTVRNILIDHRRPKGRNEDRPPWDQLFFLHQFNQEYASERHVFSAWSYENVVAAIEHITGLSLPAVGVTPDLAPSSDPGASDLRAAEDQDEGKDWQHLERDPERDREAKPEPATSKQNVISAERFPLLARWLHLGFRVLIWCDMDGVVADFYRRIVDEHKRRSGLDEFDGVAFWNKFRTGDPEAKKIKDSIDREPGFYMSLPVIKGAQEALTRLAQIPGFEVIFLTSGDARSDTSLSEKNWWIRKYFPGFEHVISRDKTLFGVWDHEMRQGSDTGAPFVHNRVLNVLIDDRRQLGRHPCRNLVPEWDPQIFFANKFECYADEQHLIREWDLPHVLDQIERIVALKLAAFDSSEPV